MAAVRRPTRSAMPSAPAPSEWRIEFPAPYYELKLDIIEFKR